MKEFQRSEIRFEPAQPDVVANVMFTILPSIHFYQGDEVLLYLYGFRCSSRKIKLAGPAAHRFTAFGEAGHGDWTQATYTLTLKVETGYILSMTKPTVFTITQSVGFRLPDKLTKDDGMLLVLVTEFIRDGAEDHYREPPGRRLGESHLGTPRSSTK